MLLCFLISIKSLSITISLLFDCRILKYLNNFSAIEFVNEGAAGHDVAFIHPRSAVGVLVELVQAPDDVISVLSKKPDN